MWYSSADVHQFRSPQMLMVSGIGPSALLNQLKIPVVVNAPGVGQGMWVCISGDLLDLRLKFDLLIRINPSTASLTK